MSLMTESNSEIFKIGDGTESFSTKTVSINEFMKVGEPGDPSKFETLIGSLTIALFPESLFEAYSLKDILTATVRESRTPVTSSRFHWPPSGSCMATSAPHRCTRSRSAFPASTASPSIPPTYSAFCR